ncbi:MAG: transposase, partial [Pyrinomonadaceae bacterium]|nr:transposase [Pyrinomonadaceae bacterium]
MLGLTCVPPKVYDFLYPFKPHFGCPQARHFVLFCWLLVGLMLTPDKGTLKGVSRIVPPRLKYWALLRMVRSGWWDEHALLHAISADVLRTLPPPSNGVLHIVGDATLKGKRGEQHPLGRVARINEHAQYCFGFEVVLLIASWERFRVPVAVAVIDPQQQGHQNKLFRQMLEEFVPPGWVQQVIVEADAGFAATETLKLIEQMGYGYVFAVARTRKFSDGRHLKDLVQHLPRKAYRRVKSVKPDGRRRDYWVYECRRKLHGLGEVTILLSKQRRNYGPKRTKIIVTNLRGVSAGDILSHYARRWGVEVCQSQPIKMTWCPLRSLRRTMAHLRGGFKREHIGDIHLFFR